MTPHPRLEPNAVSVDGPSLRIVSTVGDSDVVLEFKSDENAQNACRAIQNYLEVADVDGAHESVLRMLELIFGRNGSDD